MEKEDKEKWIQQLQHKLDDFSEDVPEKVWDSLEERFIGKRIPLWKRWQSIAAIIMFVILSSLMVTFVTNQSEYLNTQQIKHISNLNIDENVLNEYVNILKEEKVVLLENNKNVVSSSKEAIHNTEERDIPIIESLADTILVNQNSKDGATGESNANNSKTEKESEKIVYEKRTLFNNGSIAKDSFRKKNRQLSLAISSGGFGLNSSSNINGAMMRFNSFDNNPQQSAVMSSPLLYNNTLLNELNIKNNTKTKKKHYQPITFGLSIKYEINKYCSLESGLTYSSLNSKLESSSAGNVIHQRQNLKYIGIPLKINRNIVKYNKLELYGAAGGEIEKCISGTLNTYNVVNGEDVLQHKEDINISNLQFSLNLSLGAEYKIFKKVGLYVEPGAVYYFDDKSGIESVRSEHPLNLNIKLGVRYTFLK